MPENLQIVGLSPSHKKIDPNKESWGLPWNPLSHRNSRWFELHDRSLWERRGPEYLELLQNADVPIYMQKAHDDIPMSVEFPLLPDRDYYCNSIAYMLDLAIRERRDIEIWGVDVHTDEEWWFERPCLEWWLGMAKGQGLGVWVHADSSLLKPELEIMFLDERQRYKGRYGWLEAT